MKSPQVEAVVRYEGTSLVARQKAGMSCRVALSRVRRARTVLRLKNEASLHAYSTCGPLGELTPLAESLARVLSSVDGE